jgi:hypothetical protein
MGSLASDQSWLWEDGVAARGARSDATLTERTMYSALLTAAWMAATIAIVVMILPAGMIADAVSGDRGRHLVVDFAACILAVASGGLTVSSAAFSCGLCALKFRTSLLRSLFTRVARPSLPVTLAAQACGLAIALVAIL